MLDRNSTPYHKVLSIIIYLVLGVFTLAKGALYSPDSYSFLAMDFHRSIGYNSFLKLVTSIFGESFETPLILLQVALLIGASYYLISVLKRLFDLHFSWLLVVQLLLIAPAFYLHYVVNNIFSEALAYPLFLIFTGFVLKGFIVNSSKHYFYAVLVLFGLLLVRGQFIAMIPVLLILISIQGIRDKINRSFVILIGILILLPFVSGVTEKIYNKAVHGHFERTPFSNVSLIAPAFYVANEDNYQIYTSDKEQSFFKQVYATLDSLGLTKEKVQKSGSEPYLVFHANYSKVCNLSIHETGTVFFEKQGLDRNQQLIAVNDLCGAMVFPLIKHNFKDWLKLYMDNLKNAFGSGKQLLLFLMLLIASLVFVFKKKETTIAKFIFALVLIVFANMTIVPLAVHSLKRYLFYTDWVIFVILILLMSQIFTKKTSKV
jgi:hypothetical protein